jgi:hypothetical protein
MSPFIFQRSPLLPRAPLRIGKHMGSLAPGLWEAGVGNWSPVEKTVDDPGSSPEEGRRRHYARLKGSTVAGLVGVGWVAYANATISAA